MKLLAPEDFASRGLPLLWSVLQGLAEDGWDYAVEDIETGPSQIVIALEAHSNRTEPFEQFAPLIRACERSRQHSLFVTIHVHHGGSLPSCLECVCLIRQL